MGEKLKNKFFLVYVGKDDLGGEGRAVRTFFFLYELSKL